MHWLEILNHNHLFSSPLEGAWAIPLSPTELRRLHAALENLETQTEGIGTGLVLIF